MTTSELAFAESMDRRGWRFLKNGWPDFLFYNPVVSKSFACEFKAPGDRLRPEQVEMHKWLRASGLIVHVATYDFDPTSVFKQSLMTPGSVASMKNSINKLKEEVEQQQYSSMARITQLEKTLEQAVILNDV
jgi:hypothetical protein